MVKDAGLAGMRQKCPSASVLPKNTAVLEPQRAESIFNERSKNEKGHSVGCAI